MCALCQNENALSAVVLLSGELLEREQLVRLAAVCTSLIPTDTYAVQAQSKSEQTWIHFIPFWMKDWSVVLETQNTLSKEGRSIHLAFL
jgi:hypothetical protein